MPALHCAKHKDRTGTEGHGPNWVVVSPSPSLRTVGQRWRLGSHYPQSQVVRRWRFVCCTGIPNGDRTMKSRLFLAGIFFSLNAPGACRQHFLPRARSEISIPPRCGNSIRFRRRTRRTYGMAAITALPSSRMGLPRRMRLRAAKPARAARLKHCKRGGKI